MFEVAAINCCNTISRIVHPLHQEPSILVVIISSPNDDFNSNGYETNTEEDAEEEDVEDEDDNVDEPTTAINSQDHHSSLTSAGLKRRRSPITPRQIRRSRNEEGETARRLPFVSSSPSEASASSSSTTLHHHLAHFLHQNFPQTLLQLNLCFLHLRHLVHDIRLPAGVDQHPLLYRHRLLAPNHPVAHQIRQIPLCLDCLMLTILV